MILAMVVLTLNAFLELARESGYRDLDSALHTTLDDLLCLLA